MPREIGPGVTLLTRGDWGADPRQLTVGWPRTPADWKYVVFHHTVTYDTDPTPNLWTNLNEVKAHMRHLQHIREPEIMDVPYAFVLFLMENGTLVVCEGRGTRRTGAHTIGHNREWLGEAFASDLENFRQDIRPWIPRVNHWNYWVREEGCVNLRMPFRLHSDTTATACPGTEVRRRRDLFDFKEIAEQEGNLTAAQERVAQLFAQATLLATHGQPLPEDLRRQIDWLTAPR